jgi:hypothetical protein
MPKAQILKVVNPLVGVLLVVQAFSGIFRDSLSRNAFEILHEVNGFVFLAAVAVHVTLNWSWIKANFLSKKTNPNP